MTATDDPHPQVRQVLSPRLRQYQQAAEDVFGHGPGIAARRRGKANPFFSQESGIHMINTAGRGCHEPYPAAVQQCAIHPGNGADD